MPEDKPLSYGIAEAQPKPPTPDAPPEVIVEKLVYGGDGLARPEGRVVLLPFVLPGEQVRIELTEVRKDLLRARPAEVLEASRHRTAPGCPYFFRCGGCQYQHMTYEEQLVQKREILREVMRRVGKLELPDEVAVASGAPWAYRNRSQFHIENGKIGYRAFGSHQLVPVDHCPISSPMVNETLAALTRMVRDRRFPRFVRSLEVFTNEEQVQLNVRETDQPVARRFFDWCAEQIPALAGGELTYRAGGEAFRVSHGSFFQVNRHLVDRLVEVALDGAEGETAVDLYAGVGLFSLPLARRFQQVAAVESGASAVRDLEHNAEQAGLPVEVHRGQADEALAALHQAPDFVLADPPRSGLGRSVVSRLIEWQPRQVGIVSCDPATLARDLAPLLASGYVIDRVTLVDLFPQTFHLETVVRLRRGVSRPEA